MPSTAKAASQVTMKVTDMFLDRAEVIRRIGAGRAKRMTRLGGWLRTTSRRSIHKRKNRKLSSAAGKPPRSHDYPRHRLRMIVFSYDPGLGGGSLVVGSYPTWKTYPDTVPETHEHGGTVQGAVIMVVPRKKLKSQKARKAFKMKFGRNGVRRKSSRVIRGTLRYPPRPFMSPSIQKAKSKVPNIWKNALYK